MKYKLIHNQTKEEHLCDKVTIDGFDYYVSENYKDGDYVILPISLSLAKCVNGTTFIEGTQKVIATNNPYIDVPKVLDEVDLDKQLGEWKYKLGLKECKEKADKKFEKGYSVDSVKDKISHRFGYVYGIKEAEKRLVPIIMELKSQETHPFSDEDMIEFGEWCKNLQKDNKEIRRSNPSITTKELLQIWKEQKPKIVYYE